MQHRPGSLRCLTCNLVKYFLREVDFKPYTDQFSRTFILSSQETCRNGLSSLHYFLLVVRKCEQNYLSIFSFYFFRSTVASFWVLLSGLFGCQSEQRTKNIVISVRSGVFVKSTPPTTQTADVARYFKKRQTFCSFVFLRKSSRQSRAFLNGFAKISKDKSKHTGGYVYFRCQCWKAPRIMG